jgi:hypothetical protein
MPEHALLKADFVKRRAMMSPWESQFDELSKLAVADWSYPWCWVNA